jgi:hypothetical protein
VVVNVSVPIIGFTVRPLLAMFGFGYVVPQAPLTV